MPAVVSGQYQFGFSNVVSLLIATSRDLPLKVVANGNNSTGVDGQDFGSTAGQGRQPDPYRRRPGGQDGRGQHR